MSKRAVLPGYSFSDRIGDNITDERMSFTVNSNTDRESFAGISDRRRRLLKVVASAGLVGAAGCVGSGGADSFEVGDLIVEPEEALIGGAITVTASVENPSSDADTQAVELHLGGEVVAAQDVSLEANDTSEVSFEGVELPDLNPGTHRIGVYTMDDEVQGELEVSRQPDPEELITVEGTRNGVLELDTGDVEAVVTIKNPFQFELGAVEVTLNLPGAWEHGPEPTRSFERFLTLADEEITWEFQIPEDSLGTFDLTVDLVYHVHGTEMTAQLEFPAAILEPLSAPYGINLGGLPSDPSGSVEIEGVEFEPHSEFAMPNGSARPVGTFSESAYNREGVDVDGTEHDAIYATEMYGKRIGYEIDMEPGSYTVGIHVQEIWAQEEGERIFNLSVQGQPVFEELDLIAEVGRRTALAEYVDVTVEEEEPIVIETSAVVDNAVISAVEIRDAGADTLAG